MPRKGRGGKQTELVRDLKDRFPEAKESWHSAPLDIKSTFHKNIGKNIRKKQCCLLRIKTPDHSVYTQK